MKYTVVDTHDVQPGEQCPVIAQFAELHHAEWFVTLLPGVETGRYGIDGPEPDERAPVTVDDVQRAYNLAEALGIQLNRQG